MSHFSSWIILALCLCFVLSAAADEGVELVGSSWESRRYIIEGVYYFMNEGNLDTAEELFQKAILSSSFGALSQKAEDQAHYRAIVAEAFYFLGNIHYKRAMLDTGRAVQEPDTRSSRISNIAWAKRYLEKAEEYGIVYDKMHPPLLDEIKRKYPKIKIPAWGTNRNKAKVIIETDFQGPYHVNAVKIDQYADVAETKFLTDKEFDLECGARYKIEPDSQARYRPVYKTLAVLGISLALWLTRN